MPTPAAPSCLVYVIFLQSAATVPAVTGREAVMVEANSGESIKKKKGPRWKQYNEGKNNENEKVKIGKKPHKG